MSDNERIEDAFPVPRFPTELRRMWAGSEVQRWLDENVQLSIKAWEVTDRETGAVSYVANRLGFVQELKRGDRISPLYSLSSGAHG